MKTVAGIASVRNLGNDSGNGKYNFALFYYFAIIPIDSPSTMWTKHLGAKLIVTAFK